MSDLIKYRSLQITDVYTMPGRPQVVQRYGTCVPLQETQETWSTLSCCSVAESCLTPGDPVGCNTPGSPVLHHLPKFAQVHVHWVSDAIYLSSSVVPFFYLQSFSASGSFPKSALHIRWPMYWRFSFSFSMSPCNGYSVLISFRTDWFDLTVPGTLKSLF